MQIKSWQIALMGSLPSIIIFLISLAVFIFRDYFFYQVILITRYFLILSFFGSIGLITVLCLKNNNDTIRKFGAIFGIIFLLSRILIIGISVGVDNPLDPLLEALNEVGISTLLFTYLPPVSSATAGIYYFWKKV